MALSLLRCEPSLQFCACVQDCSDEDGKAHKGFLNRYDGIAQSEAYREALEAAEKSKPAALIFTGHSLGGAVAMLAALDFKLRCLFAGEATL